MSVMQRHLVWVVAALAGCKSDAPPSPTPPDEAQCEVNEGLMEDSHLLAWPPGTEGEGCLFNVGFEGYPSGWTLCQKLQHYDWFSGELHRDLRQIEVRGCIGVEDGERYYEVFREVYRQTYHELYHLFAWDVFSEEGRKLSSYTTPVEGPSKEYYCCGGIWTKVPSVRGAAVWLDCEDAVVFKPEDLAPLCAED